MKGIILHGEHGTRLRSLTHTGLKQLLPIANKPMSQYALEDLKHAGITDVAKQSGAQVISHKKNLGYDVAIATLFEKVKTENPDVMITLDGDGQHDPNQIPNLFNAVLKNDIDVVISSRFLNSKSNSPKYRKTGIRIITKASNIGTKFKITDAQSGFRAYSKKAIQEINPTEKGMSVSTEILQKASNKGFTLAEVPISVSYGKDTSEQNPVPHGVSVLMNTLKFVSVKHPLPFYGFPGIALFIAGLVIGGIFLDAYFNEQTVFFGSLLAAIVLFLLGAILVATLIILFSMGTLMRRNE